MIGSILGGLLGGNAVSGLATAADGISKSVVEVIKRYVPDPDKQLEVEREVNASVANSLTAQVQASSAVMVADSQSGSKYTSAARPTVVYWSLFMITALVTLGIFGYAEPALRALQQVPDKLFEMITYGIGIFTGGRSLEKVASTIAGVIKRK